MKIQLLWKWLSYDVSQFTHRYSKSHIEPGEKQFDADLQNGNESDAALVMRLCMTGVAKLRQVLAEYIEKQPLDATDEIQPENLGTQSENLGLSPNNGLWEFVYKKNCYDGKALADLMHWFVVRFVLWQWLKTFGFANEAADEYKEVESIKRDLRHLLDDSDMPVKDNSLYEIVEDTIEIVYTDER